MITYVTCDDVDNAFGNAWTSENAKNKAVLMANALNRPGNPGD